MERVSMLSRCLWRVLGFATMATMVIFLEGCFPPTTPTNGAGEPVDRHTGAVAPGATLAQ